MVYATIKTTLIVALATMGFEVLGTVLGFLIAAVVIAVAAAVVIWPLTRILFRREEQPERGVSLVVGLAALVYLMSNWGLSAELSVGGVVLWAKDKGQY